MAKSGIESGLKITEGRLQTLYKTRDAANEAVSAAVVAREAAVSIAPEGFLYKLVALSNDTFTELHDEGSLHPWQLGVKAGGVKVAPKLSTTSSQGFTLSWLRYNTDPEGSIFGGKYKYDTEVDRAVSEHTPIRVNTPDFALGLVSWEEYLEHRYGHGTLFEDKETLLAAKSLKKVAEAQHRPILISSLHELAAAQKVEA